MEATSASIDSEMLIDLLEEQRDLYARLRDLSERQRSLITGDRPEALLDILRDRQSSVMALARINESLSPYRRDWEATYLRLDEPLRERVGGLLGEINAALQAILKSDQEDGALLAARKRTVGAAIENIADTRRVNAAYAKNAAGSDNGGMGYSG